MFATELDLTQAVTAVAVVTGVVAGIALILKTPREAGQISVTAAQGAVVVQTGVMESLERQYARLQATYDELVSRYDALASRFDELARTSANAERLKARVADLEDQRQRLTHRVGELEAQNLQLREELDVVKEQTNGNGNGHTETNGGPSGRG